MKRNLPKGTHNVYHILTVIAHIDLVKFCDRMEGIASGHLVDMQTAVNKCATPPLALGRGPTWSKAMTSNGSGLFTILALLCHDLLNF